MIIVNASDWDVVGDGLGPTLAHCEAIAQVVWLLPHAPRRKPSDHSKGHCMRPPLPDLNALTSEQRAIYEDILAGPRGRLDPPLAVWLNSPGLARTAQELGSFCRYGTSLPPRLSELAILITGSWWRASFEWAVHAPIAIAAGLDEAVVEQIGPVGPKLRFWSSWRTRRERAGCC